MADAKGDGTWTYRTWTFAIEPEGEVLDTRANTRIAGPKSRQYGIVAALVGRTPTGRRRGRHPAPSRGSPVPRLDRDERQRLPLHQDVHGVAAGAGREWLGTGAGADSCAAGGGSGRTGSHP